MLLFLNNGVMKTGEIYTKEKKQTLNN